MEKQMMYDNGHVGLLWQDMKSDLTEVIRQGKSRFEARTNSQATGCRTHPLNIPSGVESIDGIRLISAPEMLPGYFLFVRGGEG